MFNLGLSLTFENFRRIIHYPKPLIVGLFSQMILLPLIAFIIAYFSGLSPEFKIGIILIAICPGGATANLITYWLKGNVALSISLTSINSLLILITIPLMLFFSMTVFAAEGNFVVLPFWETVGNVFLMVILPVMLGLLFKHYYNERAIKVERVLKYISTFLLAVVFSFAIFLNKDGDKSLIDFYRQVIPHVILLNVLGMLAGFFAGWIFRFKTDTLITLPIEVGIQNSTLAITIAISASFLNNPMISVPATVYGMFTFFTALIFGYLVKRLRK